MTDEERRELFRVAVETRRLEIESFWRRSLFFWGFIVASFAGYAHATGQQTRSPFTEAILLHFGFLCSFCWYLVNKGSKYWQENWEQKVQRLEGSAALFTTQEPVREQSFGGAKFSVTKITIFLSLITSIGWAALIGNMYRQLGCTASLVVISAVTLVATLILLTLCRSARPRPAQT